MYEIKSYYYQCKCRDYRQLVIVSQEVMELEEEKREGSEGDSSEWEEYTDSEEEDAGPRLKPVFVRKLVFRY